MERPEVICMDCGFHCEDTLSSGACKGCGGPSVLYKGEDGYNNIVKMWSYPMTAYEKCEAILSWDNDAFDPSYIHDVMNKYSEYGKFTSGQEEAIDRIYEKWHPDNQSKTSTIDTQRTEKQCEYLLDWASKNDWFNASMVESIYHQIESGTTLTEKQVDTIDRLYRKFVMK
jgi:hypothetical protein